MRLAGTVAALATVCVVSACGPGHGSRAIPSSGNSGATSGRAQALHLAAQCIRQHGIPGFPDPAVNAAGQVNIDKSALLTVPRPVLTHALSACRPTLERAGVLAGNTHGMGNAPTPQQLQALLAFARCMRAHGLPGFPDPNPQTGGLSLPPAVSKSSPALHSATQACRSYLPGKP
ncbi:MAG TPA: hypothetical protein VGS19_13835 [Streptosporangiaceae bacterium]|nr:hypothetical protein [Streptosporangiaceae bacterium]